MAYKHYVRQTIATGRYGLMDRIGTALEAMGWTLHDGISMANRKVANFANVNTSTNAITIVGHGFNNADKVFYRTTGTAIGGLTVNYPYYIVNKTDDTFQLESSVDGGAIDLTSQGSNNHIFGGGGHATCTYSSTTHTFTSSNATGFTNGDYVSFDSTGSAPWGMPVNGCYYVFNVQEPDHTFQLADAPNSTVYMHTAGTNGTGPHVFTNGNWRVYKSAGELSDRWPEYIMVFVRQTGSNSTYVNFRAFENWDATWHYGTAKAYDYDNPHTYIAASEGSFYSWIYGSLDVVFLYTLISTTYAQAGFGHLNKRYWPTPVSSATGAISSGSNVIVSIDSAANFIVGKKYQIVGRYTSEDIQTGFRETATLSAADTVSSPNTLTFSSITNNYDSGALIGKTPSTFVLMPSGGDTMYQTCPWVASGSNAAPPTAQSVSPFITENSSSTAPETRTGSYILQPLAFYTSYGTSEGLAGYIDQYMYHCYSSAFTREDMMALNVLDSGMSTGSNTNDPGTLNDTGKAWTTNAFATKVVIISSGAGAGEIHQIASNTATALTLTESWVTIPTDSSNYLIVDEAYRYLYGVYAGSGYLDAWLREGIM